MLQDTGLNNANFLIIHEHSRLPYMNLKHENSYIDKVHDTALYFCKPVCSNSNIFMDKEK